VVSVAKNIIFMVGEEILPPAVSDCTQSSSASTGDIGQRRSLQGLLPQFQEKLAEHRGQAPPRYALLCVASAPHNIAGATHPQGPSRPAVVQ